MVDGVFDAFGTEESPGEQLRTFVIVHVPIWPVDGRHRGTVRSRDAYARADLVQREQSILRCVGHHDGAISQPANGSIVGGGRRRNRVEDHDRRHFEGREQIGDSSPSTPP